MGIDAQQTLGVQNQSGTFRARSGPSPATSSYREVLPSREAASLSKSTASSSNQRTGFQEDSLARNCIVRISITLCSRVQCVCSMPPAVLCHQQ